MEYAFAGTEAVVVDEDVSTLWAESTHPSIRIPGPGERKQPHKPQMSPWHSDTRDTGATGNPCVTGQDGLKPQHCAGTLEAVGAQQKCSHIGMPDNWHMMAEWLGSLLPPRVQGTSEEPKMAPRNSISPVPPRSKTRECTILPLIHSKVWVTCTLR